MLAEHAPYSKALSKVEMFSDDRGAWTDNILANVEGFDILQLHWVSQFLNYRKFFSQLPSGVPVVWRLADKSPFTGGCHYDGGCGGFRKSCGSCPKLQSEDAHDLSRAIWARKESALGQIPRDQLHIVALNRWMAKEVRSSSLFGAFECTVIPNGVDLEEFTPIPPDAARVAMGIPEGFRIVAFVAESATNLRKGLDHLVKALHLVGKNRKVFLLIVGDAQKLPDVGLPSLAVGQVHSVPFLRQVYSAAHVFVIPSLEDNQPNTVLEAMACGTPVVGFDAGGIPEMVAQHQNGLLAEQGDVKALADCIAYLLDNENERAVMGRQARARVEQEFTRDGQVQKYLDLYQRLLGRKTSSGASRLIGTAEDLSSARQLATP